MGNYGLLPQGFIIPDMDVLRSGMETDMRGRFGRSMPLGDSNWLGFMIGILAERLRLLWEAAEAGYSSMDADKAVGAALEAICLLTSTFKVPAASSVVSETVIGDVGTVVASGFSVNTDSTGRTFSSVFDAILDALPTWAANTIYAEGVIVTYGGNVFRCTTGGTSALSGGLAVPSPTTDPVNDNTVVWEYLCAGDAKQEIPLVCTETGAIVAVAGDVKDIQTPTGGVNFACNYEDAIVGHDVMADQDLRLLREEELSQPGSGTPDAIKASLLEITGVTSVTIFWNSTDITDTDGVLPHSCEALVLGGADQDIADCLWANVPIGIRTVGTTLAFAADAEGDAQPILFTRPTLINVSVDITLTKIAKTYAGDPTVQTTVATQANTQGIGWDVVSSKLSALTFGVSGVFDVSQVLISSAVYPSTPPTPTVSTTVAITTRQIAMFDTTRITIHSSDATP